MEEKGFSHLPPVEPLLASHLHPTQKSAMTSASPTLPSRADSFQSSMTEKGYKAMATTVFTQRRGPPPAYRIQKRQPHPTHGAGRGQNKLPEHSGAWARKPPAPGVAPGGRAAPLATQGAGKKRRAT
ncbi:unnamed protein product [Arctogadus glacialis]